VNCQLGIRFWGGTADKVFVGTDVEVIAEFRGALEDLDKGWKVSSYSRPD
jgi:hypothetical protein